MCICGKLLNHVRDVYAWQDECHQHFFSTKTGENYACEWRPDEGRGSKCKSVLCEATMAK